MSENMTMDGTPANHMSARELLVIFGLPGSGKSTQSHLLQDRLGYSIMSLGGYFRKLAKTDEEVRVKVESGVIFPDEMTVKAIRSSLTELVGKPDTKGIIHDDIVSAVQAEAEDSAAKELGLQGPYPVFVNIDKEVARERLSVRLVCSACVIPIRPGSVEDADACAKCGGTIIKRTDDNPETIARRLDDYEHRVRSMADYYSGQGRLITVDGSGDVETIYSHILSGLDEARSKRSS